MDKKNPPKNVGESPNRHGEEIVESEGKEAGRHDQERQGVSQRPVGTSTERDKSGVSPSKRKS